MGWLIFTFFSLFMFSITSIIDSLSVKKYIKNPRIYLFYSTFIQGFIGILIFFFKGVSFHGTFFLLIAFITGMFYVYGLIPYMKSLEFEEVSRIAALFNLSPIFVLIFSFIILNLKITTSEYVGFFFLVTGSFLISLKKIKGFLKISKGFWYMMLTNLLLTGFFIGTDYLFKNYDYWSSFFFIQLGVLTSALTLISFKEYGRKGLKEIPNLKLISKSLIILVALFSFIGVGLRNVAIGLSSAALVSSLGGFQSLFIFIITLTVSFKFPKLIKEKTNKKTILLKSLAIILLIAGVYFVSIQ